LMSLPFNELRRTRRQFEPPLSASLRSPSASYGLASQRVEARRRLSRRSDEAAEADESSRSASL
jgi:hypothetical protein